MSLVKAASFFGIVHYMQVTEEVRQAWILKMTVYFLLRSYILTRHQKKHVLNIVFFYLESINERQYIQQYDILRGISHGINDFDIVPEQTFTQIIYIL